MLDSLNTVRANYADILGVAEESMRKMDCVGVSHDQPVSYDQPVSFLLQGRWVGLWSRRLYWAVQLTDLNAELLTCMCSVGMKMFGSRCLVLLSLEPGYFPLW